MDVSDHASLMQGLAKMAALPDLQSDFPEQYSKHWQNQGKSGTVQIFNARLIDQPCELTFSLFFSGEQVIQTGILVKFQDQAAINEVRKGDVFDFKNTQRLDPVAILKELVASITGEATETSSESTSFTLAVDDDAESEVFRSVQQLTGMSRDALTTHWSHLLATNQDRPGIDRASPIIKTWLKKQRDLLDMQFLQDAHLLEPRTQETSVFTAHGRTYTVTLHELRGRLIREKIDHAQPEWWGGTFYAISHGRLTRIPHDQKDRLLALKSFDDGLEFPVEDIFVDHRHIYSVIFTADKAIVWRTRTTSPSLPDRAAPARVERAKVPKGVAQRPQDSTTTEETTNPSPETPKVHPFVLARAEKNYMESLHGKSPNLNAHRQEFMKLLYDSDESHFAGHAEKLSAEMAAAAARVLGRDAAGLSRESALLRAHATIFYAEM